MRQLLKNIVGLMHIIQVVDALETNTIVGLSWKRCQDNKIINAGYISNHVLI